MTFIFLVDSNLWDRTNSLFFIKANSDVNWAGYSNWLIHISEVNIQSSQSDSFYEFTKEKKLKKLYTSITETRTAFMKMSTINRLDPRFKKSPDLDPPDMTIWKLSSLPHKKTDRCSSEP